MPRKKAIEKVKEISVVEPISLPTNHPLVFISHDTRDAELAEEFSTLLKNASAGGLKSFRSSDKKGTQGIEYGQEWYPAIMEKIDEASEVVCLLTKQSVERPWILYEAGVAKGKLNKKVIGIAMGINHSVAFTGPFAQFQNNDGSPESIKKLVLELVRKVPGLDPDPTLVEQLVKNFHVKATEIIEKTDKKPEKTEKDSKEDIVAKLFEEVKIMFESLPSKIEHRMEPNLKHRKRNFHPMMLEELMHFGMKRDDPYMSFLVMLSFFKEDFPWFFEIGMETYRALKSAKNIAEKNKLLINFRKSIEMLDHPIMREFYGHSKENYFMLRESSSMFHHFIERILEDKKK